MNTDNTMWIQWDIHIYMEIKLRRELWGRDLGKVRDAEKQEVELIKIKQV